MDFKKTFIDLTQWVIPHGYEESITHLLPEGCQKDGKGNYSITIGESETLFTCHLDTVSSRAKITHVFEDNWIKTDGTTILGGDNKAGVCILMYLIEQNVPGTYYFFVGEECGRLGSKWALENNGDFFRKFKRAIAFDRRNRGSIITHQSSRLCASSEFTEALSKEMAKSGLEYKADSGGSYTDTYTFIDAIPECTNLSASVMGEHTTSEKIDIVHCEEIAKAASLVDWEKLPSNRDFSKKEWKSYNNYSSEWDSYFDEYRSYDVKPKAEIKKKSISECGLEFDVSNIDKFFNLKKIVEGEEIYYKSEDGKSYYINIDYNLVAVEEDMYHVYPYFIQHYVKKDNLPTTFEELWYVIKDLKISFKPIEEQKNIPFYQNNICEYFDLEEIMDNHKNRLFIDPLTLREFQFEFDDKWVGIWEVLNREPYVSPIYANDNTFKSFSELWADIREYVPFRRNGKAENPFFNGGTKIKSYNKILDVVNVNNVIPFTHENVDKYFDLVKVSVNKSTVDNYYKSPNGEKIYFIEISPNSKAYVWERNSGSSSLVYNKQFFSFDSFWSEIKDKVEFKKREDDLDDILSQLKIPFRSDNIEKFFNLKRRERDNSHTNANKKSLFFKSENDKSYFFKIEEDGYVYMVDLSGQLNGKTQVIINYVRYNSFEKLWEDIKDKVDFKKNESKPVLSKESLKIPFTNDNVCRVFNFKEQQLRSRHYLTEDTNIQYYFDILENNIVYLWERINGKFNTIVDGAVYNSFDDIWKDVQLHVKFKKREVVSFTQDNVSTYFDLVDSKFRCFYYHKETDKNFFIHCGKNKNKSVVKLVKYKDLPETNTGVKQVDRMENLYFSGVNSINSFDEFWEEIKDKVPFKKRGAN